MLPSLIHSHTTVSKKHLISLAQRTFHPIFVIQTVARPASASTSVMTVGAASVAGGDDEEALSGSRNAALALDLYSISICPKIYWIWIGIHSQSLSKRKYGQQCSGDESTRSMADLPRLSPNARQSTYRL